MGASSTCQSSSGTGPTVVDTARPGPKARGCRSSGQPFSSTCRADGPLSSTRRAVRRDVHDRARVPSECRPQLGGHVGLVRLGGPVRPGQHEPLVGAEPEDRVGAGRGGVAALPRERCPQALLDAVGRFGRGVDAQVHHGDERPLGQRDPAGTGDGGGTHPIPQMCQGAGAQGHRARACFDRRLSHRAWSLRGRRGRSRSPRRAPGPRPPGRAGSRRSWPARRRRGRGRRGDRGPGCGSWR